MSYRTKAERLAFWRARVEGLRAKLDELAAEPGAHLARLRVHEALLGAQGLAAELAGPQAEVEA